MYNWQGFSTSCSCSSLADRPSQHTCCCAKNTASTNRKSHSLHILRRLSHIKHSIPTLLLWLIPKHLLNLNLLGARASTIYKSSPLQFIRSLHNIFLRPRASMRRIMQSLQYYTRAVNCVSIICRFKHNSLFCLFNGY